MGDGRYYTFYQFYSVVVLVFIVMFTLAVIITTYYKHLNKKEELTILSLAFVNLILRAIEVVIPNKGLASSFKCMASILFLVAYFLLINYLFGKKIKLIKEIKNTFFGVAVIIFSLISILVQNKALIEHYEFFSTSYSLFYKVCVIMLLIRVLYVIVKCQSAKENIHRVYKNKVVALWTFVGIFMPLCIYFVGVIIQFSYLDFIEYILMFLVGLLLSLVSDDQVQIGVTGIFFDKIGDMVTDFIYVTDVNGSIIYKNYCASKSQYFKKLDKINVQDIDNLYEGNIQKRKKYFKKEYVYLTIGSEKHYFSHKISFLQSNDETLGHIITITEITHLMEMLYQLEEQRKKSKEVNDSLKNYAQVVYHLEKEKKINSMLQEIIATREQDMENLIFQIINLEKDIDSEDLEDKIDETIQYNSQILEDVRSAVSAFREHYGG